MNAPYKIYLSKLVMAGVEVLDKPVSDSDVEYIRTGALLDWLHEQEEHGGPATTIQHIINRIKTL